MNYIFKQQLYKALPIALPLLAGLLYALTAVFVPKEVRQVLLWGLVPTVLIGLGIQVLYSVEKHQDSAPQEAFLATLFCAVASWWLPSLLFLLPFSYLFLNYRRAFDRRTFSASVMALVVAALYASIAIWQEWVPMSWYPFFRFNDIWTSIPVLLLLIVVIVLTNVQPDRRGR